MSVAARRRSSARRPRRRRHRGVVRHRRGDGARARGAGHARRPRARRADRLAGVCDEIRAAGGVADACPTDLRDEAQVTALVDAPSRDTDGSTRS
jgi:hypothetical protein